MKRKRRFKKIVFFILFISLKINSQELLLHYPFDGNTNDISGNSYNGNPNGVVYVDDRDGNPNSAVYFDGINDFINLPNLSELKPSLPVSISLWVKFDDLLPQNSVVFTTDYEEDNHSGVFMTISTSGKLAINYGDARGNTISSNRRSKLAGTNIIAGIWYHVVAIVKGPTDMDIFVNCANTNGTYSGSGAGLGYTTNSGSIGRKDANTNLPPYYFKGSIDEFKYYNGIITPASIETSFTNLENKICLGEPYTLPTTSTNGITGSWSPTFDSTIIGIETYTFTPDVGQCASSINHSLEVVNQITTSFTNLENKICLGESYTLPTTSTNGITGSWSPTFDSTIIGTETYTFTPDLSQCASDITHSLEVINKITTSFTNLPTELNKGDLYTLPIISDNGVTGNWFPPFTSETIGITNYTFTPSSLCGDKYIHNLKIIEKENLIIPLFFTPNGDNTNDLWLVKGINNYTEVKIIIFDRYGKKITEVSPLIGWDGNYNEKRMPSNDYWYFIKAIDLNGGVLIKKGHFSLIRR